MKKNVLPLAVLMIMMSCQNAPKTDTVASEKQAVSTVTGTDFVIDTTTSTVGWTGANPLGQHNGIFKMQSGTLVVNDKQLVSGKIVIDINSLTNKNLKSGDGKEKLEGHLKGADFFDVAKYPTAVFEITKVEPIQNDSMATHKISGNLTLKDSTKNVTFPAKIAITENAVSASANFTIDRTKWGMHYGNDKSLGDKFIKPEVTIQLDINSRK